MLFLTEDNAFAGKEQTITMDELKVGSGLCFFYGWG